MVRAEMRNAASPANSAHDKLIGLIDELRLMILVRDDSVAVEQVLNDLADIAGQEFVKQEELLRQSGTPQWREHKLHHDEMSSRLDALHRRFAYEPAAFDRTELYDCLSDWLVHVLCEDQASGAA